MVQKEIIPSNNLFHLVLRSTSRSRLIYVSFDVYLVPQQLMVDVGYVLPQTTAHYGEYWCYLRPPDEAVNHPHQLDDYPTIGLSEIVRVEG